MTPYVSYKMYWAARESTAAEQRLADEQIGRLSASVSNTLAGFRPRRRSRMRRVLYANPQMRLRALVDGAQSRGCVGHNAVYRANADTTSGL